MCVPRLRLVHSCAEIGGKSIRHAAFRSALKPFSVVGGHESERGLAKIQRLVENSSENWRELTRR
jgi:hypothetical protein